MNISSSKDILSYFSQSTDFEPVTISSRDAERKHLLQARLNEYLDPSPEEIDHKIEELQKRLLSGLLADRELILQEFPELKTNTRFPVPETLMTPEQRNRLERMLCKAWLVQAKQTKLKFFRGYGVEREVLLQLGYYKPETDDGMISQLAFYRVLRNMEAEIETSPQYRLESLYEIVLERAQKERLKLARVNERGVENLCSFINEIYKKMNTWKQNASTWSKELALKTFPDWEYGRVQYALWKHGEYLTKISRCLQRFIISNKKILKSYHLNDDFKALSLPTQPWNEKVEDFDDLYKILFEYQDVHKEFFLSDDQDALITGTCFAQCFNLALLTIIDPDANPPSSISESDRFIQALHLIRLRLSKHLRQKNDRIKEHDVQNDMSHMIPRHSIHLSKLGDKEKTITIKEQMVFSAFPESYNTEEDAFEKIAKKLSHAMQNSAKTNGGLYVSWRHHGMFLRFDPERKKTYLFEPSFGALHFTQKDGETKNQLAIRMAKVCLQLYIDSLPQPESDENELRVCRWIPERSNRHGNFGNRDVTFVIK